MRRFLTARGTSATIVGIVVVLAGGGYAVASGGAGTVKACVNHVTHTLYAGPCARHDKKLTWNKVGPVGPRGPQGNPGTPGTPGTPGAPGTAKAYGYINSSGTFDAARSKNVTASSTPVPGEYCVTVSGASAQTEGAVATPNWSGDDTNSTQITHAEWRSSSAGCASPSDFDFKTFSVTANGTNLVNTQTAEGFFFIVP